MRLLSCLSLSIPVYIILFLLPEKVLPEEVKNSAFIIFHEEEGYPESFDNALLKEVGIKKIKEGELIDEKVLTDFIRERMGLDWKILEICNDPSSSIQEIEALLKEGEELYAFMDWTKSFKKFDEALKLSLCIKDPLPFDILFQIHLYLAQTAHYSGKISERDRSLSYLLDVADKERILSLLSEPLREPLTYIFESRKKGKLQSLPLKVILEGGEIYLDGRHLEEGEGTIMPGIHFIQLSRKGKRVNMMVDIFKDTPVTLALPLLLMVQEKGEVFAPLFSRYLKSEIVFPEFKESLTTFIEEKGVDLLFLFIPMREESKLKVTQLGRIYHYDTLSFEKGRETPQPVDIHYIRAFRETGKEKKIALLLSAGTSLIYFDMNLLIPIMLDLSLFVTPDISLSLEGGFARFSDSSDIFVPCSLSCNYYFSRGALRPFAGAAGTTSLFGNDLFIGGDVRGGIIYYLTRAQGLRYFIQTFAGAGFNGLPEFKLLLMCGVRF